MVFYFWKEGKILSHDPETQQVDIEILSSLPGESFRSECGAYSIHPLCGQEIHIHRRFSTAFPPRGVPSLGLRSPGIGALLRSPLPAHCSLRGLCTFSDGDVRLAVRAVGLAALTPSLHTLAEDCTSQ